MKSTLLSDVKKYSKDKIKRLEVLLIIMTLFAGVAAVKLFTMEERIIKRIEYRYYNLTRSLEDTHNVQIETKEGRAQKRIIPQTSANQWTP